MDTDLFVVVGFLLAALAFPSAMSSYAEGRFPKVALIVLGMGILVFLAGWLTAPAGWAGIAHAFIEILARIFN